MSWTRAAAMLASLAAIAAACSSFDEPPLTPDASDGGDAGGGDAPTGNDDGSTGADANADAGADGASGDAACMPAPSGCAGGVLTKIDFSTSGLPPGWSEDTQSGSIGTVTKPGPCSADDGFLRATTTIPNDASASGNAYWATNFEGEFKSVRIAFAFRGPKPVAGGYANIGCVLVLRGASSQPYTTVRLTLEGDDLDYGSSVRGDGGATVPDAGGTRNLDQAVTSTTASQWHTVDAKLAIGAQLVTVSPAYDGKSIAPFTATLLTPVTRVAIECGIDYSDEANATYQQDIDDVFLELCP